MESYFTSLESFQCTSLQRLFNLIQTAHQISLYIKYNSVCILHRMPDIFIFIFIFLIYIVIYVCNVAVKMFCGLEYPKMLFFLLFLRSWPLTSFMFPRDPISFYYLSMPWVVRLRKIVKFLIYVVLLTLCYITCIFNICWCLVTS